jgi:uncharacterized membrane protein (DUF373 family)
VAKQKTEARERRVREWTESGFGFIEDALYVLVALALAVGGIILFGSVVYDFASKVSDGSISTLILELLDGLLLVFIITELIHTIRVVIDEKVLVSEPFLVVGIVAAIRRLVVVSAEAKDLIGKPTFSDAMLEIGLLAATVLALGGTIFLLRHTTHSEPRPGHEPD